MTIDWEQPAKLTCTQMLNISWTAMPDFDGTLRACLERAAEWPANSYPTIWLVRPIIPGGKSVIDTGEIPALRRRMKGA
ncbi:MAG TPA: hypothetical protein VFI23_11465 [Rhizomicrobium sp.]|nr:hypothetical protein [Rhizomicrobium sp.]